MDKVKNRGLITVIMPVFNRENLVEESLTSILNQSYRNWECIVVDDHSTDNTESIVADYVKKDGRFKFYRRPDSKKKGANSCRNYGLDKANGEFIHWFDSDDIGHPMLLEKSLKCIEEYQVDYCRFSRKIFFGSFKYHFESLEKKEMPETLEFSPRLIEKMLINKLEFNTCNVVWKKTSLNNERFCENIVYADEWEFYSRLLMLGLKGVNLENILIFGRKHPESTTSEYRLKNPVRVASKIKAAQLVLNNLYENKLFTPRLKKYFLRMGFEIKSYNIIKLSLKAAKAGLLEKLKYKIGYQLYPVLKPIFYLKSKILKS